MHLSNIITSTAALAIGVRAINEPAQNATVFALTYGYPLLAYEKVRPIVTHVGVNAWFHYKELQGAGAFAVVKPNLDTIYSAMIYDLSSNDVIISIPEGIPDTQFALITFEDPFGTDYASLGSGNQNTPGNYRLTVKGRANNSSGTNLTIVDTIESSSVYGTILTRWLLNNTNQDAINQWQDQTVNQTVPMLSIAPALADQPSYNSSNTPAENVLNLLKSFAPYTLPSSKDLAASVNSSLAAAGIANGTYTAPSDIDLASANSTAVSGIVASASASDALIQLNNGWSEANSSLIGIYNDNYAFRASVAAGLYLGIKAPNAIYPSYSNGSSSTLLAGTSQLGPNDAFVYTFSSIPPLMKTGFWSLTLYENGYLINSTSNIHIIASERSNITYPDGSLVDTKASNVDKPFQILVQPGDKIPPSNWTNNWLPGPSGGGNIQVTFRIYDAAQELLDGEYRYPVVTKQCAIVGSTATNASRTMSSTTASSSPTSSTTTYTGGTVILTGRSVPFFITVIVSILFLQL